MNTKDKAAYENLLKCKYTASIELWSSTDLLTESQSRKNLAILYCMLLDLESNELYLKRSVALWKEIFNSSVFWDAFIDSYKSSNDESTSEDVYDEFRKCIPGYLSDIYSGLYRKYNDPSYLNEFQLAFSIKSENVEKEILAPLYASINANVENLNNLTLVSDDKVFDETEMAKLKPLIELIQDDMNKLINLGLYDDSQTKVIRDMVAESIRGVAVDMYGHVDKEKVESLLMVALKIVGTSGQTQKLNHDLGSLHKFERHKVILDPVYKLMAKEDYQSAINLIESESPKHIDDNELYESFIEEKEECIYKLAFSKWRKAENWFEHNKDEGLVVYKEASELIYDNLDIFNINKDASDAVIKEIETDMLKLNADNFNGISNYRKSHIEVAEKNLPGQYSGAAFIIMIDYYINVGIARVITEKDRSESAKTFWQIVCVIIFFAIIAYFKS